MADPSCEGRPFLVDACPRIVTPAYAKPRLRVRSLGSVYPSKSPRSHPSPSLPRRFSLLRCAFLRVRRCASSCRHVHTYLVTDRKSPDLSSLREKLQMCESTLRTQLKRIARTRVDKCVRNWNFYISSLSFYSVLVFCYCISGKSISLLSKTLTSIR